MRPLLNLILTLGMDMTLYAPAAPVAGPPARVGRVAQFRHR